MGTNLGKYWGSLGGDWVSGFGLEYCGSRKGCPFGVDPLVNYMAMGAERVLRSCAEQRILVAEGGLVGCIGVECDRGQYLQMKI